MPRGNIYSLLVIHVFKKYIIDKFKSVKSINKHIWDWIIYESKPYWITCTVYVFLLEI